jgi:hypothetical protein
MDPLEIQRRKDCFFKIMKVVFMTKKGKKKAVAKKLPPPRNPFYRKSQALQIAASPKEASFVSFCTERHGKIHLSVFDFLSFLSIKEPSTIWEFNFVLLLDSAFSFEFLSSGVKSPQSSAELLDHCHETW